MLVLVLPESCSILLFYVYCAISINKSNGYFLDNHFYSRNYRMFLIRTKEVLVISDDVTAHI